MHQLRKLKQRPDENVQNYAERLLALCDDAFPGDDTNAVHIQKQLVETFIDGVTENSIACKLLRERPTKLDNAVEIATQEQQTARAFELRREETPMEIDAIGQIEQSLEKCINDLTTKVDTALTMMVAAVQHNGQQETQNKTFHTRKSMSSPKVGNQYVPIVTKYDILELSVEQGSTIQPPPETGKLKMTWPQTNSKKQQCDKCNTFLINNNIDPQRLSPLVQVQFKQIKLNALVDIGADKSVISEEFFKSLEKKDIVKIEKCHSEVCGVTGHKLKMLGSVTLKFKTGRTGIQHKFFIICNIVKMEFGPRQLKMKKW